MEKTCVTRVTVGESLKQLGSKCVAECDCENKRSNVFDRKFGHGIVLHEKTARRPDQRVNLLHHKRSAAPLGSLADRFNQREFSVVGAEEIRQTLRQRCRRFQAR